MKPAILIITGVGLLLAATNVRASHPGPAIELSLNNLGQVVVGWDNTISYRNSDPSFGSTFNLADAIAQSPAFRFMAGSTPTNLAYSFVITTDLYYWNHLVANSQWGQTPNGEFIEIFDSNGLIAVVTDGVSVDSPDAMSVPDGHEGGRKTELIDVQEDLAFTNYHIYTPDGQGGKTVKGTSGMYGFGMQVHLWQENETGDLLTDHGLSDPFFVGFRPRQLPSDKFAEAIEAGQLLVPEPSSAVAWGIGSALFISIAGPSRKRQRINKCPEG